MKLAIKACTVTLLLLTLVFAASAQKRSDKDDRNTAPTVGTGGPVGGPTGLFTVYDAQTLRKGEYTFSAAYSNYDRDPGNVDITSVPLSFQVGVSSNVELFFATEAYRGVHVNSPRNLSSFYLPNSQLGVGNTFFSPPAIILAANGPFANTAFFRAQGPGFFSQFPFTNLGTPRQGGAADVFPGVGSAFGSILPGIVLRTNAAGTVPVTFTVEPSYLNDAPFINRLYGTSSFNTFDAGVKWRINNNDDPIGYGIIASYRWYTDSGDSFSGFNQLQRGSGPGGDRGDINVTVFTQARLTKWANMSANVGFTYTTNPKGTFGGNDFTLLDRPNEFLTSVGVDFPINKHFQPMAEFRNLHYVGGHTPNAFERDPSDIIAGLRYFPARWWGMGAAYRLNLNQQDSGSFSDNRVPAGFTTSDDPHGFIGQVWVGRRDKREGAVENKPPNIDSVDLNTTVITLPCPAGTKSRSGACEDNKMVGVTTKASDPENDVLTYNYTVSGGRVIGTGANVQWDLSAARPGTYTITTGVDDGCGVCGKTNTQTIKVQECPDCAQTCACPTVSVSGPTGIVKPGESITFVANVSGGDVTFNWSVSAGTISSGQGTSSITVDTNGLSPNSNVTATVDIGGTDPNCNCTHTYSETASIAPPEIPQTVAEFGVQKPDEIKAQVDNFYIALNNSPNSTGYILNYGKPAEIKKRRADIEKAVAFRKYDRSRIQFVDGPDTGEGIKTKFSVVPAGVAPPTP